MRGTYNLGLNFSGDRPSWAVVAFDATLTIKDTRTNVVILNESTQIKIQLEGDGSTVVLNFSEYLDKMFPYLRDYYNKFIDNKDFKTGTNVISLRLAYTVYADGYDSLYDRTDDFNLGTSGNGANFDEYRISDREDWVDIYKAGETAVDFIELKTKVDMLKQSYDDAVAVLSKAKVLYDRKLAEQSFEKDEVYHPDSIKTIVTRCLEFQQGTLIQGLEIARSVGNTSMESTLKAMQLNVRTIGRLFPKFTIDDGEGIPYSGAIGEWIFFSHSANGSEVDVINDDVSLSRASSGGGLYNTNYQSAWNTGLDGKKNNDNAPTNTKWTSDGADPYLQQGGKYVPTRKFTSFMDALSGNVGSYILNQPLIMYHEKSNTFHQFFFVEWGQGNGGSFAYLRRVLDSSRFTSIGEVVVKA
jgi:hypothetical protein